MGPSSSIILLYGGEVVVNRPYSHLCFLIPEMSIVAHIIISKSIRDYPSIKQNAESQSVYLLRLPTHLTICEAPSLTESKSNYAISKETSYTWSDLEELVLIT